MIATTVQGDTLDLVCHRHLGTTTGGVVEAALALNPGLCDAGPVIATGTAVTLPEIAATAPQARETVNLWD